MTSRVTPLPRPTGNYEDRSINRPADNTMKIPLTTIEDHGSPLGLRSDPVRLSRKAAVKRNSTKDKKTKTDGQDSKVQSTRVSAPSSFDTSVTQSSTEVSPLPRRFSFDLAGQKDAIEALDTPDFLGTAIFPAASAEVELVSPPVLEAHQQVRTKIDSSPPQLPTQAQRSHRATREERNRNVGLQDLERDRRRVPTTFAEILGELKTPTALL